MGCGARTAQTQKCPYRLDGGDPARSGGYRCGGRVRQRRHRHTRDYPPGGNFTGCRFQVTCARHPVYYFSADQKPGDISGEGTQAIGGGWDLVSQAGKQVEKPGG
jgi:Secreted repeat of unknown function